MERSSTNHNKSKRSISDPSIWSISGFFLYIHLKLEPSGFPGVLRQYHSTKGPPQSHGLPWTAFPSMLEERHEPAKAVANALWKNIRMKNVSKSGLQHFNLSDSVLYLQSCKCMLAAASKVNLGQSSLHTHQARLLISETSFHHLPKSSNKG